MLSVERESVAAFRRVSLVTFLAFSLAACGGGGGGGGGNNPPPPPQNKTPVAYAGIDLAVREGETVALDGSGSGDEDGTLQSFQWAVTADEPVPELSDATTDVVTFTAPDVDQDTAYTIDLTVTDNKGATASDTAEVLVFRHVEGNQPPEPVVAPLAGVEPGAPVLLDGSASLDGDGAVLAYEWRQLSGPAVELNGADTAIASFQAPAVEAESALLFRLVVTDNRGERSALDVKVVVGNGGSGDQPPVAEAGPEQIVNAGDIVQLNGVASHDSEEGTLTYAWTQTGGNDVFEAVLDDPASVAPAFTAPAEIDDELVLTFELTVTDAAGQESKDSISVAVRPLIEGNQLPNVTAGGAVSPVNGGSTSTLIASSSSDPDGTIVSYRWVQVAGPVASLEDADQDRARFAAPFVAEQTTLTFRLTVTDNVGAVAHDDVDVIINASAPVRAVAKVNGVQGTATVLEGGSAALDGRGSLSLGGQPLTYTWVGEVLDPVVDPVNPAIARITVPETSGNATYRFELTVSDGTVADTDDVYIEVRSNLPPSVEAGADITVNAGDAVTLDGSADDPEGGPLAIQWEQVTEENVPAVTLEKPNTLAPGFTAPAEITEPVTLRFRLVVTDDVGQTEEDVVAVNVVPSIAGNQPPVAVAADQTVDESALVTLDGSDSNDPDGNNANLAFEWIQFEIPEGRQPVTLSDPNAAAPTFSAPATAVDLTLRFRLIVTDEKNSVSAPKTVTVTVKDTGPDIIPDEMVFEPVTGVEPFEAVYSNQVELTGIDAPVTARLSHVSGPVQHNQWEIERPDGSKALVAGTQTLQPGYRIRFRGSVTELNSTATWKLVFGDSSNPVYETSWSLSTKQEGGQAPDPATFDFPDVSDLEPGEVFNTVLRTPAGPEFDTAASVSVSSGGTFFQHPITATGGSLTHVKPGDEFKIRFRPHFGFDAEHTVTVSVGSVSTDFTFTTRVKDETTSFNPDAIPARTGLDPIAEATADVTVSDFDGTLSAMISGPQEAAAQLAVSTDGGATFSEFASSAEVSAGDVIRIRSLSPEFNQDGGEAEHTVTLTVGTESRVFTVGTRAPDRVPDPFSIPEKTDAAVGAYVYSEPFTIPGIEIPVPLVHTTAEGVFADIYVNGQQVETVPPVGPDDELMIGLDTPDATSETVVVTITAGFEEVGQQSADFVLITSDVDTTPDPFVLMPITGASRDELVESNIVTVSGIPSDGAAVVTISGDADASYAIKRADDASFGAFTNQPGVVENGDQIKVRLRASLDFATQTKALLDVGGRLGEFVVTSEPDTENPVAEITFPVNGGMFNAEEIEELTVFVKVSDGSVVETVLVNGTAAELDNAAGQWRATVPVAAGANSVEAVATDAAGNAGRASIRVNGETGLFANVVDMRWQDGKFYVLVDEPGFSRIVEVDAVTGARRTLPLEGEADYKRLVPGSRESGQVLFVIDGGGEVDILDVVTGAVSPHPVTQPIPVTGSHIGVLPSPAGDNLVVMARNSTGTVMSLISPGGTSEVIAFLENEFVYGLAINESIGWLLARTGDGEGALIRVDLSDPDSVSFDDRRTFDPSMLDPVKMNNYAPNWLAAIPGQGGDTTTFYFADRRGVSRLTAEGSDDMTVEWVTGFDNNPRTFRGNRVLPHSGGRQYSAFTIDDAGNPYLFDQDWSMVVAVDPVSGDRTPVSGHHGAEPASASFLPNASQLGLMPDGTLLIERDVYAGQSSDGYDLDGLAKYDVANATWLFLEGSEMDMLGGAHSIKALIPVSESEVLVVAGLMSLEGIVSGVARASFDSVTGRWTATPFSVVGDGNLPDGQVEDLQAIMAATQHPVTGELWILDREDSGQRYRLWRMEVAGPSAGLRHLVGTLPEHIEDVEIDPSPQLFNSLAFTVDGRLFWNAVSTSGSPCLLEVNPESAIAWFATDSAASVGGGDLVIDDMQQLAYLSSANGVDTVDILADSGGEGSVSHIPLPSYPSLDNGHGETFVFSAFDGERRRLWLYSSTMRTVYLIQPDTGEAVMLPKH